MRPGPLDLASEPETPKDAAARWLALKRSGQMTANDEREFGVWLEADLAHRPAVEALEQVWRNMGAIREDPEIMALREANARAFNRPARRRIAFAAAASFAMLAAGGWVAVRLGVLDDLGLAQPPKMQEFRTSVGQRTTVTLPDGSVVSLDTDTVLRTRETAARREVELERGQAFFKVAKDPSRPFVVAAAGKTVTATGTAFDVRVEPDGLQVTLAEGRVRVEQPRGQFRRGQAADMIAGWRLEVRGDDHWRVNQVDVAKQTSWLTGRLTFVNDPLGAAVEEMNRYTEKKIVLRDAKLAGAPIVGVFRAGDVDGFVKAVRMYRLAHVALQTDDKVELAAN